MRIGVFSVLYQNFPFEQALDKIAAAGASAVEIGTGGLPGSHHCNVDELLASAEKRAAYLKAVESARHHHQCPELPLGPHQPGCPDCTGVGCYFPKNSATG